MKEEEKKYVLKFEDRIMVPKSETVFKDFICVMLIVSCSVIVAMFIILRFDVFSIIPSVAWLIVLLFVECMRRQSGYKYVSTKCELWFYNEYMIQYYENKYYNKRKIQKEFYKFSYNDVEKCLYLKEKKRIYIYGMAEVIFYKCNNKSEVMDRPKIHKKMVIMSSFCTAVNPNIYFVEEIENHSPIQIVIK